MNKSPLFDTYDDMGTTASLYGKCLFCRFIVDKKGIIYEDEYVVAFHDHKPACRIHLQVIPKRHIKNIRFLKKKDAELIAHMKAVGTKLLLQLAPGSEQVFGFHKPPFNSVNHLHLHCMAKPFKSVLKKVFKYWMTFPKPEDVIRGLNSLEQ